MRAIVLFIAYPLLVILVFFVVMTVIELFRHLNSQMPSDDAVKRYHLERMKKDMEEHK